MKTAICIHVYYDDMWEYLAGYLRNAPKEADIFVTCREEILGALSAKVQQDFPRAEIVAMPNHGMDVLPFLLLCKERQLHRYDAVLKLHTKNRKSKLRAHQGKIMLDGLCGTSDLVQRILKTYRRDPHAGMIGTAFQIRSANALMYGNRDRVRALLDRLEIELTDWPFFTGTMFWIAGYLLRDLAALAPDLLEESRAEAAGRTGGDGALAHALERVFGALNEAAAANVYLTEKRHPESDDYLLLPRHLHGPANDSRLLELGSSDLVRRHIEATQWRKAILRSEYFDFSYYAANTELSGIPGMDDIYHFILYGDLLELNPSNKFSTTYYQIRRQDVVRERICSLAHYINQGLREETSGMPSEIDWQDLAVRHALFDKKWYEATYPDVYYSDLDPFKHYNLVGQKIGRAASPAFDPKNIPVLADKYDLEETTASHFFKNYYLDESHLYSSLKRAAQNGDYEYFEPIARRIRQKYGASRALNEAMATHYTIQKQWVRAKQVWEEFWEEVIREVNSSRHGATVLQFDRPSQALEGFRTLSPEETPREVRSAESESPRICIYTTLFGDIDALNPVLNPAEGVDYLCFTDRLREAEGWQQIIVDPRQPSDNLNAKIFKVLPQDYLQDYDYSLFVDANTVFLGRTEELIALCRAGGDFVMWQHPLRDDIYTEVCAIIGHRRHSPPKVLDQLRHYSEEGLPRNTGMFEASFIWRRHGAPEVAGFMREWWDHICRFSSRDQISLAYLVWKTGYRPVLLPPELGTSRENIFFFKAPHRNGRERPEAEQNPLLAAPTLRNRTRDITFLYHDAAAGTGSTVLRGQQLSGLVREHYEGEREVRYLSDPTDIRDEVVVLTKGVLKATTPEALRVLRRHNILVADFVDEPPRRDLIPEIDMLMASSLCGYRDYLMTFPDVPAFHVTHHVDTRIPRCMEAPNDRFRAGYFGELVNTIRHERIEDLVDFNLVDTSRQSNDWIAALEGYNFHYAFRRTRGIDGAKPFLKGFVAAHCGANMMIQRSAGDAIYYLGADYPYLMADEAGPEEIASALEEARDGVGGPEWRHGRDIMRQVADRSSVAHVMREFERMLEAL